MGERRYELLFMDHPKNPRPTTFNTRDYGRFGSYFVADVTSENVDRRRRGDPAQQGAGPC